MLALLLTWRLVDANSELAAATGRAPLCSYLGLGMSARLDGLLVETRIPPLMLKAWLLSSRGIAGHQPLSFNLHLHGTRRRVLKFIRPRPVASLPQEMAPSLARSKETAGITVAMVAPVMWIPPWSPAP